MQYSAGIVYKKLKVSTSQKQGQENKQRNHIKTRETISTTIQVNNKNPQRRVYNIERVKPYKPIRYSGQITGETP